jgi:hypothetical protein
VAALLEIGFDGQMKALIRVNAAVELIGSPGVNVKPNPVCEKLHAL